MQLDVQLPLQREDASIVELGLRAFTDERAGPVDARSFGIYLRDDAGTVVGGLNGELRWTWLYIAHLWLPGEYRGRGIGTALLMRAETFAREQGARAAYLDTLEFHALEFYEKHGYRPFGVLQDFPPGFRRFYLQKSLV
jgi:GNAT superfamily N-acetyltransferase